mgnify:FL=1
MGKPAAAVKTTRVVANPTFEVTVNVVLPLGANRHSIERVWLPEVLRLLRREPDLVDVTYVIEFGYRQMVDFSFSTDAVSGFDAAVHASQIVKDVFGVAPRLRRYGDFPCTPAIRGVVAERRP